MDIRAGSQRARLRWRRNLANTNKINGRLRRARFTHERYASGSQRCSQHNAHDSRRANKQQLRPDRQCRRKMNDAPLGDRQDQENRR